MREHESPQHWVLAFLCTLPSLMGVKWDLIWLCSSLIPSEPDDFGGIYRLHIFLPLEIYVCMRSAYVSSDVFIFFFHFSERS